MEAVSEVLEPMVDGSGSSTDASVKGSGTSEGLGYFDEPFLQDGPEAVAVNGVTGAGVTHFGSAENANVIGGGRNIFIVGDA